MRRLRQHVYIRNVCVQLYGRCHCDSEEPGEQNSSPTDMNLQSLSFTSRTRICGGATDEIHTLSDLGSLLRTRVHATLTFRAVKDSRELSWC